MLSSNGSMFRDHEIGWLTGSNIIPLTLTVEVESLRQLLHLVDGVIHRLELHRAFVHVLLVRQVHLRLWAGLARLRAIIDGHTIVHLLGG